MDRLLFATAGSPISSRDRSKQAGLDRLAELGLDGMELEFVRGVRMAEDPAEVRAHAKRLGLTLTAHGPYFVNLASQDKAKLAASVQRVLETARVGNACGAVSCTFHAAFLQGRTAEQVHTIVRERLRAIVATLRDEGNPIRVRPETTGKPSQFAGLEELLALAGEVEGLGVAIDWAHLHARTGGRMNTPEEFREALGKVEAALGREELRGMHMHMAGIEYTAKGERNHLNLEDSDLRWREVLGVLREFKVTGIVISESPNIEGDAVLMRDAWRALK